MNRFLKPLIVALTLGFSFPAHATVLFVDQMDYDSSEDMRSVWKSDAALTTDTDWTYNANGLSFTNHFASAGGAQASISNQVSYAPLDSTVQITGSYGDDSWNGATFTFYMSYLISTSSISNWYLGTAGAAIRPQTGTPDGGMTGFGAGFGQTDPDSDDFTNRLAVGDSVSAGAWRNYNADNFQGDVTMQLNTTYLLLARFDYTNPTGSTYNPYTQTEGLLRGRMAVFTEGDEYPMDEADIIWDIDEFAENDPRAPGLSVKLASLSTAATGSGNFRMDELRIGTEYGDVMVVIPEPQPFALLGLVFAGLLFFRRRRSAL